MNEVTMTDDSRYRLSLRGMQERLEADIQRARDVIPHAGEKGRSFEDLIREALRAVLPGKIGVSHGFVIDAGGEISKQMDVVLYDQLNTPRIYSGTSEEEAQMFPVESTYACGELKTRMNKDDLADSLEKCLSYKHLRRWAYHQPPSAPPPVSLFGTPQKHWQSIFFCIAREGTDCDTLGAQWNAAIESRGLDVHMRIDHLFILDRNSKKKNCILNTGPNNASGPKQSVDTLPWPGSKITPMYAKDPWALFIQLLLQKTPLMTSQIPNMLGYDQAGF